MGVCKNGVKVSENQVQYLSYFSPLVFETVRILLDPRAAFSVCKVPTEVVLLSPSALLVWVVYISTVMPTCNVPTYCHLMGVPSVLFSDQPHLSGDTYSRFPINTAG